jgi:hypothetical protein
MCYPLAPLFTPCAWLWFVFGVLMMLSFAIFLLMPAVEVSLAGKDSTEFHDFLLQRGKQGILTLPILLLWGLSWI